MVTARVGRTPFSSTTWGRWNTMRGAGRGELEGFLPRTALEETVGLSRQPQLGGFLFGQQEQPARHGLGRRRAGDRQPHDAKQHEQQEQRETELGHGWTPCLCL